MKLERKKVTHFSRETLLKGRHSTVDLLALTRLDQLLWMKRTLFNFYYKTRYVNEEVNRTEPSLSGSIPCTFQSVSYFAAVSVTKKKSDNYTRANPIKLFYGPDLPNFVIS